MTASSDIPNTIARPAKKNQPSVTMVTASAPYSAEARPSLFGQVELGDRLHPASTAPTTTAPGNSAPGSSRRPGAALNRHPGDAYRATTATNDKPACRETLIFRGAC
jgi:hypothetical protein